MSSSSRSDVVQFFRGIDCLLTFAGAAKKQGRRINGEDLGAIPKAAMVARAGRIVWVGPERRLPKALLADLIKKPRRTREVDLRGSLVLPGFIDCHTHFLFAGNRADEFEQRNRGASYQEIAARGGGILSTVRATRGATAAGLARVAQERVESYLRQGVTTVEVKSGYGLDLSTETKMLQVAGRLKRARIVRTYLGPHAVPPEFSSAAAYLEQIIAHDLPVIKKKKLASRVDIFVEDGYFNAELARTYLRRAKELGFDLVVHAEQLSHSGGARVAVEFGARSAEHLIHIDKHDIQALAASELSCVLLPAADLYLRCPYPPARALLDAGARVALATDFNPGSSPTQNLSLVGVLARLEMRMTLPETLVALTVGPAFALGLEASLGSLETGKLCDFSALNGSWQDLFYSIGEMPIRGVWREGTALT